MKVLQINSFDFFSTGNIMLQIAETGRTNGLDMYTAAKKTNTSLRRNNNIINHYLIGSRIEHTINRVVSSLTDFQDVGSFISTIFFIKHIKKINPDIIHIHDIAGYYLNLSLFFKFLKSYNKPIIWTFHCCWAYTGRCIYYDYIGCDKWKTLCDKCPQNRKSFPKHITLDLSKYNFKKKRRLFTNLNNLTIVAISNWINLEAKSSFFNNVCIKTIYDGIDLDKFYPEKNQDLINKYDLNNKKILLGVASIWSERKGLKYFLELSKIISSDKIIVLIGLSDEQLQLLPPNIIGIKKTFDVRELRNWYSNAAVFVNPTMEEGLGLVNLEAQACGTPVITFKTGGSVECINEKTGKIVEQADVLGLKRAIEDILSNDKQHYENECIEQASKFDKKLKYQEYIELYREIYDKYKA